MRWPSGTTRRLSAGEGLTADARDERARVAAPVFQALCWACTKFRHTLTNGCDVEKGFVPSVLSISDETFPAPFLLQLSLSFYYCYLAQLTQREIYKESRARGASRVRAVLCWASRVKRS